METEMRPEAEIQCRRLQIALYFALFTLFRGVGGGLAKLPVAFHLKDRIGLVNVGVDDLIMRSCPKSLEGTGMMLTSSLMAIAASTSDLFGTWLYGRGGFGLALGIATAVTALILPVLSHFPAEVIGRREAESGAEH